MNRARVLAILTVVAVVATAYAYELNGRIWPGSHPRIPIYISTTLIGNVPHPPDEYGDYGTFEDAVEHIKNAIGEWNDWLRDYRPGGSDFQFYYAGLTDVTDVAEDGINAIIFRDEECPGGPGCPARIFYMDDANGVFHGIDIAFYSLTGDFGSPIWWSGTEHPLPFTADIWTVMLHELGHGFGLGHSLPGTVMGPDLGAGITRRELTTDDIDGILALYGEYTNEGFWTSTPTAAPGETFTLHLDYPLAANQQYRIYVDLTGDNGFPLRNWDSRDSRILPLNGNFLSLVGRRDVFVDFGTNRRTNCTGQCRTLDANGQATATVNLPPDAIEQFGTDLHFAVVTYDTQYVNDIEDVSVGVHVSIATACAEDIDGSGAVDFGDILAILAAWGNAGGPEDLDGSGTVDFGDLLVVLAAWGPCK